MINRLQWHVHDLEIELAPGQALNRIVALDRLRDQIGQLDQLAGGVRAEIALELIERIIALTRRIGQLKRRIEAQIRPLAPQLRAARTARSAQSRRGRGLVRRRMATSWRSTRSSTSLAADARPSSRTNPSTCRKSSTANATTRRDHVRPAITAGQRPRANFWHPAGAASGSAGLR
jgi:hypothetical protein